MDVTTWKKLYTSFRGASDALCAALARRLATTFVDPAGLAAFTACQLIALNKNPGVRPIGIGEAYKRLIAKSILCIVRDDVLQAAGPIQLCAGQSSGCEASVLAMKAAFESPNAETVLEVDATNAFNCLNHQAALRNISVVCPSFACVLINTYRVDSLLYIDGDHILSQEGTTQGDLLAMTMYALSVVPLIQHLAGFDIWYADDASAGGDLRGLCHWWDELSHTGPDFGYFPNTSKTCLIVKPSFAHQAKTLFFGTGIIVSDSGKRYLGSVLGTNNFFAGYVRNKVASWALEIEKLSVVAITQPQAAFAAFTLSQTF